MESAWFAREAGRKEETIGAKANATKQTDLRILIGEV
jgi:hypothetical protein